MSEEREGSKGRKGCVKDSKKTHVGSIIGDKLRSIINKTSTKWMSKKAYENTEVRNILAF